MPLLALALRAHALAKSGGAPPAEVWAKQMSQMLRRALPLLAELIVSDQMRAIDGSEKVSALPPNLEGMVRSLRHARHLVLAYVVRRVEVRAAAATADAHAYTRTHRVHA